MFFVGILEGINDQEKWNSIRNKIEESSCSIVRLQETKREIFELSYIRQFAPRRFNNFDYVPSLGASGGILVLWNGSLLHAVTIEKQTFAIHLQFTSCHNSASLQSGS